MVQLADTSRLLVCYYKMIMDFNLDLPERSKTEFRF